MKRLRKFTKVVLAILTVCLCVGAYSDSAHAYTSDTEWGLMIGGAMADFTEEGVTLNNTLVNSMTFWQYTENEVDLQNFSVTFTLEQPNWWTGNGFWSAIALTDREGWGGNNGPLLLLRAASENVLHIEGQVLHKGIKLTPSTCTFNVDTTQPITLRGTAVSENVYRITVDGDENGKYEFTMPEGTEFTSGGTGYFSFGNLNGLMDGESLKMTVLKVCDYDMTGVAPEPEPEPEPEQPTTDESEPEPEQPTTDESEPEPEQSTTDDTKTDDVNGNNVSATNTTSNNIMMILMIVLIAVIVLVGVGIIVTVLYVRKKNNTEQE